MIIHIDMDAFYASVEERDDPSLRGQPVIVGGSADRRGVVAAANYEARRFGVHSAMATAKAVRLCPQAVLLKCRIDHYAEVSRQIRAIFEQFTPLVEPLSLDEAFLDVTRSEPLFGPAVQIGREIKAKIREQLRLVASVGVAPTKFVAKIASDVQKPDGFVVVEAAEVAAFLEPLPVGRLWGVGKVTGRRFEQLAIRTIGQLRQLSMATLTDLFGNSGEHYWQLAHGIDPRPVVPDRESRSISHETTFAVDIADQEQLQATLIELAEQVARRLRTSNLHGRTVALKVRFADFSTVSRSHSLAQPTNITQELIEVGLDLLANKLPVSHPPVRLLGFGVENLSPDPPSPTARSTQGLLFADEDRDRRRQLDRVADEIAARFGNQALRRGSPPPGSDGR